MLIALDVNDDVVDEAIELGADLIIAHHAIIYRPLKRTADGYTDGQGV